MTLKNNNGWEDIMFYLSKDKSVVVDSFKKIVGFVNGDRFTQFPQEGSEKTCDKSYTSGFQATELEQISELLQKNVGGGFFR